MTDLLVYGDSMRSPEIRHEVPVAIPDAFLFAEVGGRRVAVVTAFEVPRIKEGAPDVETVPPEKLGADDLLAQGLPPHEIALEVYARACRELGITRAAVPPLFSLELADKLRAEGVEIVVDRDLFENRRRSKNATEVAGLRRAQRACEAALDVAREMLRNATAGDTLLLDGEPLTVERIKLEVERVFSAHGAAADEFIVSHGAQTAIGHEMGSGAILPDEPIVFDLFRIRNQNKRAPQRAVLLPP